MSKLCIMVFRKIPEQVELNCLIERLIKKYNLGIFYELSYEEPFLKEFQYDNNLIYSLSDNFACDNCEMLLLPDNCVSNARRNHLPFQERMKQVENILKTILDSAKELNLFVGDSGALLNDFDHYKINIQEFIQITHSLNSINPPYLHLTITQ